MNDCVKLAKFPFMATTSVRALWIDINDWHLSRLLVVSGKILVLQIILSYFFVRFTSPHRLFDWQLPECEESKYY